MKLLVFFMLLALNLSFSLAAADEGLALSYAGKESDREIDQAVLTAIGWAEGEYEEACRKVCSRSIPPKDN